VAQRANILAWRIRPLSAILEGLGSHVHVPRIGYNGNCEQVKAEFDVCPWNFWWSKPVFLGLVDSPLLCC
jgi:hypothetical protein